MRATLLAGLIGLAAAATREELNFDFGWRHSLVSPQSQCPDLQEGKNYGNG